MTQVLSMRYYLNDVGWFPVIAIKCLATVCFSGPTKPSRSEILAPLRFPCFKKNQFMMMVIIIGCTSSTFSGHPSFLKFS